MKVAGSGTAIATGAGRALASGPGAAGKKDPIPADKGLGDSWKESLYGRGRRRVYRGKALDSIGMPIGGIGTGQLYLRGDGTLGIWQIFNRVHPSGVGEHSYRYRKPDSPVDSGFAVAVQSHGRTEVRTLDREGFRRVEYNGEYPIGTVTYKEHDFPVEVEMEAFSPFIPLNAKDSALPATVFSITVRNTSNRAVRSAVIGRLENAVCFYSAPDVLGLRRSRTVLEPDRAFLLHSIEEDTAMDERPLRPPIRLEDFEGEDYGEWEATGEAFGTGPARGTLPGQAKVEGYEGEGLVNSYLGGDESQGTLTSPPFSINRRHINFLIGGGSDPEKTAMHLYVEGKMVRTAAGRSQERLLWRSWNVEEFEGLEGRIQIVDRSSDGWGHINVDSIELSDAARSAISAPLDRLEDYGTMALALSGEVSSAGRTRNVLDRSAVLGPKVEVVDDVAWPAREKMTAGLMSRFRSLRPGGRRTFLFVLAWHFPNHPKGHEYANRFADAAGVARYVLDNRERLAGDTRRWHDAYYDSTLPYWLLDRIHSTVSNLATGTCQWWKNGRFWAWEGVGCCHGTCTHVWNYAHAHARLFPELARSAREMQDFGAGFHRGTGLVGFRGGDAYAADGQCGTILKAYREHQSSPDSGFLRRNWTKIRKALLYSIEQDGNSDGLIKNSQHNTYDIDFYGANTFVGSLYLAALRAAEEMASEIGDGGFAWRVRRIFEEGKAAQAERLWDGEYFIQDVNLEEHPKHQYDRGCLSDQLFGEGWARQLHLGPLYPGEKVRSALRAIWKYNWAPDIGPYNKAHPPWRWFVDPRDAGLFVCTWPKSPRPEAAVNYCDEVWTGIEYQVAGHMIWEGMTDEGLSIVKGIDDRYQPLKRNPWNEVECGDHYARALASWGVLIALAGYEYHGPKGYLAFAPRVTPENFRCAFTAAEGWGVFSQTRDGTGQKETIALRWGTLRVKTLAFAVPDDASAEAVTVILGGKNVVCRSSVKGERVEIALDEPTAIERGESLEVLIAFQD